MKLFTASTLLLVSGLALVTTSSAEEPICQPTSQLTYDFIVVGAGTAGSAAAGELARALPNSSILLIDQGKDNSDKTIVMDNDEFLNVQESPYCEHHFSTETALAGNTGVSADRNIYTCVSKIMGGASSINYGGWYRAPQSDLDEWAELANNEIWNYDNLLPYFKRLEAVERDPGAEPNPDRGYDGIIPVRHGNVSVVHYYSGMIDAMDKYLDVKVGDQDSNNRNQDAVGALQVSRVKNGCWYDDEGEELGCADYLRNGSAYNAFVRDPQRQNELPNLHILQGAKVVQLKDFTMDNMDGDMTVEYVFKSYRYQVKARHEILLSAGSWANPKIALLSGIGNKEDVEEVGIESKIDLPGVGQKLVDHGVLWLTAMLNNVQTVDLVANATLDFDPSTFSGVNNPLPALLADANTIHAYFKSNETMEFPDMEFMTGYSPAGPTTALALFRLYQNKGASGAGGFLKLRSDDPDEEMDTSRNWYTDDASIEPMLASLKTTLQLINVGLAQSAPFILSPNAFTLDFNDDEALKAYIRTNVVSEMHLQGSMKMGNAEEDPMAVVDSTLKVVGSNGRLRIADTSAFPTELRGHPMATAMAFGMRAAELIAEDFMAKMEVGDGIEAAEQDSGDSPAEEDSPGMTVDPDSGGSAGDCAFAVAATAATTCAFAAFSG